MIRPDSMRWTVWLPALAGLCACSTMDGDSPASRVHLERALDAWLEPGIAGPVYYFSGNADLDRDGRMETIVYLAGPMVCGSGGCNTLVLANGPGGPEVVSEISVSRPPIRVASEATNGWQDIIVHVAGGGIASGYDARLPFDGSRYASNPTVAPAQKLDEIVPGETVIGHFDNILEGVRLR